MCIFLGINFTFVVLKITEGRKRLLTRRRLLFTGLHLTIVINERKFRFVRLLWLQRSVCLLSVWQSERSTRLNQSHETLSEES